MVQTGYQYHLENGEWVTTYTREHQRVDADDAIENLKKAFSAVSPLITPRLPKNCAFYYRQGEVDNYIIEMIPDKHTVTHELGEWYDEDRDKTFEYGDGSFTVAMPWQYFVFKFTKAHPNSYGIEWMMAEPVKLFWAKQKITSLESLVFTPMMLNIDESAEICLGDTVPESDINPSEKMEDVVGSFYTEASIFNRDLGFRIPYDDFEVWERLSKTDPTLWKEWYVDERQFKNRLDFNPALQSSVENFHSISDVLTTLNSVRAAGW